MIVLAPFAFAVFCHHWPSECIEYTGRIGTLAEADVINHKVNATIRPQADIGDVWTLAPRVGDCEDYAITKRHELIKAGWPSAAVRLAIVHPSNGEGHMVLVVSAQDGGDYVLDNLTDYVMPWRNVELDWVSIQSKSDPRVWHMVD